MQLLRCGRSGRGQRHNPGQQAKLYVHASVTSGVLDAVPIAMGHVALSVCQANARAKSMYTVLRLPLS